MKLLLSVLALAVFLPSLEAQPAPEWTRGATCYEIFVRSFRDSDGDGIGDLKGIIQSLDYLNDGTAESTRDLGVRCLWLMPVMESPSYHGYDVVDYYTIDRDYGTNADFKQLVAEAHRRGIRILVDMVPNHVSSQHPWFQSALRDPASPYRSWFRFSPEKGPLNRWGGNNWHKSPVRSEYYYGFFWQGMPDLNYETPAVLDEMRRVATFWLTEMGVDGFRLDAVKFLVEEGARADDTPGTHRVLSQYAAHVRQVRPAGYTIGEVFDSTGALFSYYPDQLDGYFAFEIADSLIAAVRNRSARGLLAPVLRLQDRLPAWRWSPFLRNHDQPRTVTELGGDLGGARLAAVLQLTLPGLPFVYYGEELGMAGPKPDERIRTPMAWTLLGPHAGFSRGTPWQALGGDSLTANVAAQDKDPGSLLALYRRLIHLRAAHPALAEGRLVPLESSNDAVVAFARRQGERVVLVVANLGRTASRVRLRSATALLNQRSYEVEDLLSGAKAESITVDSGGMLRDWSPVLAGRKAYLFETRER